MENTVIIERRGKKCEYFNDLKWVMKARDPKSNGIGIRGIFVDDGLVIATDGHRLHMIYTELNIANGNYEIISSNKDQITLRKNENQFPDYVRVFPKWKPTKTVYCNGSDEPIFRTVYHDFADNVSWPPDQLHDVYMDNANISFCRDDKKISPLCLYDNDRRAALIMPINIDSY